MLTASNAIGLAASALAVTIFDTGSSVVREVWTNAPGVNVSDIPVGTTRQQHGRPGHAGGHHRLWRQLWRAHSRLPDRARHRQLLLLACRQRLGRTVDFERQRAGQQGAPRLRVANGQSRSPAGERLGLAAMEPASQPEIRLARPGGRTTVLPGNPAQGRRGRGRQLGGGLAPGSHGHQQHSQRRCARLRSVSLLSASAFGRAGHLVRRQHAPCHRRDEHGVSAPPPCGSARTTRRPC